MAVDLTVITGLTVQINSVRGQISAATDPTVKAILSNQLETLEAQLSAEATHQQAQLDASNNIMSSLGLFSTLTSVVGNSAPTILTLFGIKA